MQRPHLRQAIRTQRQQRSRVRLIQKKDGIFEIQGMGHWRSYWRDPYHFMLTIPWVGFGSIVGLGYVLINAFFACLYLLEPNNLTGGRSGSFEDAFFFSVHTLASIGYGVIAPKTTYANVLVTIEAIVSLLLIAVVTGLSFARFSKPTSRILFSRHAVVTLHEGVPTLMFRAANKRRNFILDAQAKAYISRDEITAEGIRYRRVYDLKLLRTTNPSFALTWNIMHAIDAESPLYGITEATWHDGQPQIIISLMGLDDTVAYNIQVRHVYHTPDLLWYHRLADVIHFQENGDRYLDYDFFHETIPHNQPE
jgi:inward rectifier potassium channel